MRVVVIDNYDSFTFNIVDLLETLGAACTVIPNDGASVEGVLASSADAFLVSPGPCAPDRSGVSLALCRAAIAGDVGRPLLGVCLGHQALASALGADVIRASRPMHGKTSRILHEMRGIFRRMPPRFVAAQYNSLVVDVQTLPEDLEVTATSETTGEVMAFRHRTLPLASIQFHPESHLSEAGNVLLGTWLDDVRGVP